ncbi:hypothetical protein EVAR_98976_1 [Eumeta japonica]|uniref:Uncharacterized protein n=1 Tax=Eumeta variegata TaxID=151549 RepID=A0A4C1YRB1_EUMVA|nr:hypothetical protein EVAR_98976_1 [Eumeta japonica]
MFTDVHGLRSSSTLSTTHSDRGIDGFLLDFNFKLFIDSRNTSSQSSADDAGAIVRGLITVPQPRRDRAVRHLPRRRVPPCVRRRI